MVRIRKAKELLEGSRLGLGVIAKKLGLDKSNFMKSFKKATGVTPREWRRGEGRCEEGEMEITDLPIFSPDSPVLRV
jgi:AraC-like DNA-binding protein